MNEQLGLLEQTLEDVILDLAEACGGIKKVACELRPQMEDPEDARRWFSKCVDTTRREQFQPRDLQLLLRIGRRHGVHTLAAFLMRDAAYEPPRPMDLQKEAVRTQQSVDQLMEHMRRQLSELDRVRSVVSVAASA